MMKLASLVILGAISLLTATTRNPLDRPRRTDAVTFRDRPINGGTTTDTFLYNPRSGTTTPLAVNPLLSARSSRSRMSVSEASSHRSTAAPPSLGACPK